MRIAVCGSHATGKSTLVAELAARLPTYIAVEEPYYALLAQGHPFADRPSVDDLELLIARACESLTQTTATRVLFDRTPIDYWAYLFALHRDRTLERPDLFREVATSMASLDLAVFVPIEQPDRIDVDASEGLRLRRRVDALIREFLVEDTLGLGVPTLEVAGTGAQRARQVLERLEVHLE